LFYPYFKFFRLIYEDEGTACIVHRMNNSRRYDENKEEQTFDFSKEVFLI